ncbi:GMC family oxidoreductase N-terminal domain-containing protein [Nocardioides sp. B-3]|uniref:GMC family oxidoreductase N-terminal domain-containing protein n=1 Tax=Nocardioides sp. B-3 TaxID=2895565 RepID=UPI0021534EF4|nr:GMC oxidoreductase [Nocardioides sp. B-3]
MGLPPLSALLQEDGDLPGRSRRLAWRRRSVGPGSAGRPTTLFSARSSKPCSRLDIPSQTTSTATAGEGFARFDRNVHRGRRLSAARAYLHPVRHRKNLTVETMAMATRVRFRGTRAVGVDYLRGGRLRRTVAAGEIVLCGGAINTPQLLQLSGVGDRALLAQHGIDVVHHSPGVGENLRDHLEVYIQYASKQPVSIAPGLRWRMRPKIAVDWLFFRRRLGATNHFEGGGFARSNEDVDYPNLMFHFLPIAIRYDGTAPTKGHGYECTSDLCTPTPAGTCASARPIRGNTPRCCSTTSRPRPIAGEWVEAVRVARDILNQPAFEPYNDGELSPGPSVETDREILDWVARDAETALHPSCTAKMGLDEMSVVDPASMSVHGLEGLRVVDASVFPYVTNGNIYAPVMMVAEKAADLIAGNTPLPPAEVPYYRYRDGTPLYPPGDSRNHEEHP